ncbi:hypothetical protein BUALT_Bualt08G0090400 [Buddleja alternifolia]|uniref:F-box domain-containing protein n=1 Tax=Buddleja alternifolia TaxID=168488 RepID=A0AAV6XBF0_9LAMI|nr:hypothetical protein BUALT_Bualt08G0090400 [Buddleja alternifolia]
MAAPEQQNHLVSHSQRSHNRIIISDMADDVVERIASFLPIKDAHRLSVLSRRFRYSWKFCRDFSFDRNFAENLSKDEFKNIVNNFFHHHSNPSADRFRLYFDANGETVLISYWIASAVRLGINELELDFTPSGKMFTLSYELIDFESIKTVKLVNCELHLPFNSNGLSHLRDLTFEHVRAHPVSIQAIFVNCLALRTLQLINCGFVFDLKIPSLGSKELNDVILDITYPRRFQLISHRRDMMISLAYVKSLKISSTFLEGLCARFEENEYKEVDFYLWKLKEFNLVVARESYINPSDIVIFLKKCPQVERVFIDVS